METTLIAVPCMDQVPAQFAQSLATLRKVGACVIATQVGSLIYTSRNNLAAQAIKYGADYIFWLDSDMLFPPDTLERMLKTIKEQEGDVILTGLYCRRVAPFHPTLFKTLEVKDEMARWTDFDEIPEGLFEVEGCGFGCVLAPTSAFVDVQSKFGRMFSPIGDIGEDLSFCWRARECGWKILCDPSIELGHVGHHIITREFWEDYKAFAQENKHE